MGRHDVKTVAIETDDKAGDNRSGSNDTDKRLSSNNADNREFDPILPEELLSYPLSDPDEYEAYDDIRARLKHHGEDRERFCYMQTPGFFECYNGVFGIENHLCYLALYPDEINELYRRQLEWSKRFASNALDLGMDMIHISDDWGAQNGMMFSKEMWGRLIRPRHAALIREVKRRGAFVSLHSDGNNMAVLPDMAEMGYDLFHPWQESSNMPYDVYLNGYSDKFALLGGLCIQTTLGFGDLPRLEREIERVFGLLKGKRWIFCTTHFVQEHCGLDELVFAYDKVVKLARE
jgi:uroporphyrinogen decarboxylase